MQYKELSEYFKEKNVDLIAVSKTKPVSAIQALYDQGQRAFGENKVQEVLEKKDELPQDIQWHLIGHLQTNKVRMILPFATLIHSVDSMKLLKEIDKEARKINKVQDILLQMYIAQEETKFGLDIEEFEVILNDYNKGIFSNVCIKGLMGMASFTDDRDLITKEFLGLKKLFDKIKSSINNSHQFTKLSMGMSGDYDLAVDCGSNMVRIGSLLFGSRNYN